MKKYILKKGENLIIGILALILIFQIVLMVVAGVQKKGFFVDELWGYGLANSYYHPHIYSDDVFDKEEYLSPEYFKDYLEVSYEDAFKYGSVFYNQSQDAHPPLFYCVIHTISSFFRNTFSKWYGIIPNIIYFIVSGVGVYILSLSIIRNKYVSLLPVIFWGFSTQTVSYTILVRMYMMFTMFAVLNTLLHKRYLADGADWDKKLFIGLFFVNLGGCLTQYYYYIFAFFFSAFTVFIMLFKKQWKQIFLYSAVMLSSVISAVIIFPGIINTFKHNRGGEAIDNLVSTRSLLELLKEYLDNINDKILYGWNKWLIILIMIGIVLFVILGVINNLDKTLKNLLLRVNWLVVVIGFVIFFYMMIIIKISPFIADRYYYPIMPLVWILVVYWIYKGFGYLKYGTYFSVCIMLLITSVTVIQGYKNNKIMYQYKNQGTVMKNLEDFKNASCIYIIDNRQYTAVVHSLELQNFSEIKVIDVSKVDLMNTEIHDQTPYMVAYIDERLNQEEIINQICQKTKYKQYAPIGRGSGVWWEDAEEIYIYAFR